MPTRIVSLTLLAIACTAAVEETPTIIVTAERGESELARESTAVQVVEAPAMRDRGNPTETVDWFKELSGVGVFNRYGGLDGGVPDVRVRGLDSAYTQVVIDGIPVNNPVGVKNDLNFAFLAPAGISRLELVKGPQSGLYGSRAVAGVAGIQTIRPTAERREQGSLTAGSFGTVGADLQATGMIGERLGYAAAIEGLTSDGFSSTTSNASGEPDGSEEDALKRISYNGRLEYAFGSDSGVYVGLLGNRTDQRYDDFYYDGTTFATLPKETTGDPVAGNLAKTNRLSAGGHSRIDGVELSADIAWTRTAIDNHTIYGQGYLGGTVPDPTTVSYNGDDIFAGLKADWHATTWLRTLVGVDAAWEQASQARSDLGDLWDASQATAGIYASARGLWTNTSVSVSVRGDQREDVGEHLSGRVGAAIFDDRQICKLRASIGNGYRAPSLYELNGVELGFYPYLGNPDLQEETFIGGDVGIDLQPTDDLLVAATWFETAITDKITYDQFASPSSYYNDDGHSRVYGVETNAGIHDIARTGIDIDADYTHQISNDANQKDFSYNPSDRGGVRVTARQQPSAETGLWQSLRIDRTGPYFAAPGEAQRVDGYTLLGAAVGVSLGTMWEMSLRVENLLDERYVVTPSAPVAYATMPRSYFATVTAKF